METKGCHNCNYHCVNHKSCDVSGICKQGEKWEPIPDPLSAFKNPLPEQESKSDIKDFVKKFMQSYEPDTFIPNKHDQYVYRSECGRSGLNLVAFFEDLLEEYAQSHPEAREIR